MDNTAILDYNTEREKLAMPEYGRNVLKMVEDLKAMPDKAKRSEQARAVIKTMEILNPQVHSQENWEHKLWDHLYMIAGFDLDIDSPYPVPDRDNLEAKPQPIPIEKRPVKAACYGRNIENMIKLIAEREDDEAKREMIRALALYMRQQYLIWNKDSVADATIFADIEKLSDGRLKVPEGLELGAVAADATFARPGMIQNGGKNYKKNRNRKRKK